MNLAYLIHYTNPIYFFIYQKIFLYTDEWIFNKINHKIQNNFIEMIKKSDSSKTKLFLYEVLTIKWQD